MQARTALGLGREMAEARRVSDALFEVLRPEAWYDRPIAERHRLIFYLGHLEAFDWNLLGRRALGERALQPGFDSLFAFGIDPPEGYAASDRPEDWPRRAEVERYRRRVREALDERLDEVPESMVHVAIEHRLMHAETFAYLLHGLAADKKIGLAPTAAEPRPRARANMLEIPAGRARLGQEAGEFGWDNEFRAHDVEAAAFEVAKYKVTNAEYLEWVEARRAEPPHFWERRGGEWFYRGMFGTVPLPPDWPVYVTQREAAAYAEGRGMRLMTEAEYHRAAYGTPEGEQRRYPWGDAAPGPGHGNFDFRRWEPEPVDAHPAGDSAFGVAQLCGNGWEWTSTVFAPFAGFEAFDFYPGYSRDFFDGQHFVMKGGSPRTAARLLRRPFRNWFRAQYPYVYGTFRVAGS